MRCFIIHIGTCVQSFRLWFLVLCYFFCRVAFVCSYEAIMFQCSNETKWKESKNQNKTPKRLTKGKSSREPDQTDNNTPLKRISICNLMHHFIPCWKFMKDNTCHNIYTWALVFLTLSAFVVFSTQTVSIKGLRQQTDGVIARSLQQLKNRSNI